MRLAGRRVVVVGMARSGVAAARLAVAQGAEVVGVDLRPAIPDAPIDGVRLELGPHRRDTFLSADCIVVSPGVPPNQPDLVAAEAHGVTVIGEIGFAAEWLDIPMVGVTGTNGKSTVTWFLGQLLEAAGFRPFVGGNLGNPLCSAALSGGWDVGVVEVSSYQLERAGRFHPRAGVILNLTPDHLARHGDMDGYAKAKLKLFSQMTESDLAVLPAGDERLHRLGAGGGGTRAWLGAMPGVMRSGAGFCVGVPALGLDASFDLAGFTVPGEHNRDNAATATLLALAMGAEAGALQAALPRLQPLAHRMQVVADRGGVRWINDSKATNVDAARVGLSGLGQQAVVLLGGQAKGDGFAALAPLLAEQRAVVCFGASGPAIADELASVGIATRRATGLADAVHLARALARAGDAILLSPGCASFDEFSDFEHRGTVFAALAQEAS
jgi:UDP-N-acetylmuramoylalanine--D-glutamate ligase